MEHKQKTFFRDMLRNARAEAYRDTESSNQIFFAFERLGMTLTKKLSTLGGTYKTPLKDLAKESSLYFENSDQHRKWHTPFSELYELFINNRNDALHGGAYARHLTTHAIQLSLVMEDALMSEANKVSDFMVRDVVQAQLWQPISFIRQQMLENSFSFLPIWLSDIEDVENGWYLLSDSSIAEYLRILNGDTRKGRLAKNVVDFIHVKGCPTKAICRSPETDIEEVVSKFNGKPILIMENDKDPPGKILGILSAFDVL